MYDLPVNNTLLIEEKLPSRTLGISGSPDWCTKRIPNSGIVPVWEGMDGLWWGGGGGKREREAGNYSSSNFRDPLVRSRLQLYVFVAREGKVSLTPGGNDIDAFFGVDFFSMIRDRLSMKRLLGKWIQSYFFVNICKWKLKTMLRIFFWKFATNNSLLFKEFVDRFEIFHSYYQFLARLRNGKN